jgi:hypothetical protein
MTGGERSGGHARAPRLATGWTLGTGAGSSVGRRADDADSQAAPLPKALDGCVGCGMCGRHVISVDAVKALRRASNDPAAPAS